MASADSAQQLPHASRGSQVSLPLPHRWGEETEKPFAAQPEVPIARCLRSLNTHSREVTGLLFLPVGVQARLWDGLLCGVSVFTLPRGIRCGRQSTFAEFADPLFSSLSIHQIFHLGSRLSTLLGLLEAQTLFIS